MVPATRQARFPAAAPGFTSGAPIRVGVVSFVNTLPLIDGLERLADLELRHSVPSLLIDQLCAGEVDLALGSSIDYQRAAEPLVIVPCGLLGCDGPTLTVRLFSAVPMERLATVHCDTDSHTSVALLRIVLKESWGIEPRLIDFDTREHATGTHPIQWPETVLLIGDKVVTDAPPAARYPHQLDLGAEWKRLTGLPFVFAVWMARRAAPPARLAMAAAALDRQRRVNRSRIDPIVHHRACPRRWPPELARTYLRDLIDYEFTAAHRAGLEAFFTRALRHGLIDHVRPLVFA